MRPRPLRRDARHRAHGAGRRRRAALARVARDRARRISGVASRGGRRDVGRGVGPRRRDRSEPRLAARRARRLGMGVLRQPADRRGRAVARRARARRIEEPRERCPARSRRRRARRGRCRGNRARPRPLRDGRLGLAVGARPARRWARGDRPVRRVGAPCEVARDRSDAVREPHVSLHQPRDADVRHRLRDDVLLVLPVHDGDLALLGRARGPRRHTRAVVGRPDVDRVRPDRRARRAQDAPRDRGARVRRRRAVARDRPRYGAGLPRCVVSRHGDDRYRHRHGDAVSVGRGGREAATGTIRHRQRGQPGGASSRVRPGRGARGGARRARAHARCVPQRISLAARICLGDGAPVSARRYPARGRHIVCTSPGA